MSSFRILRSDRRCACILSSSTFGAPWLPSISPRPSFPSFLSIAPRSTAAPGLRSRSGYSPSQASGVSGSPASGRGARGVPVGPPPQPRAPLCDRSARGRRCVKAEAHRRGPTRTPVRGPRERQEGGGARRREAQNPIADPPAAAPPPPLLRAGAGDAEPRSGRLEPRSAGARRGVSAGGERGGQRSTSQAEGRGRPAGGQRYRTGDASRKAGHGWRPLTRP